MRDGQRRVRLVSLVVSVLALALAAPGDAAVKPRLVLVVPFDASALAADDRWMGEGVAQIVGLGLAQHPAFNQLEPARLPALGQAEAWGPQLVLQTSRTVRADAAIFGEITRKGAELTVRPRLYEVKGTGGETMALEPITVPEGELLARMAGAPAAYARTMKVSLTDAEAARMDKAARPTRSRCSATTLSSPRGRGRRWRPRQPRRSAGTGARPPLPLRCSRCEGGNCCGRPRRTCWACPASRRPARP